MIESEARTRLSDLVAATVFPALTVDQLTRLLRQARRVDADGYIPSSDVEWAPNHVYALGDDVVPAVRDGRVFRVSTAGTSGATTEPDWNADPVPDGTAVLQEITAFTTAWSGTWDFNRAAAEGWRIKAGLVSNRHQFGSNQGNYNPEQLFDHCMKMVDHYAARGIAVIQMAAGHWTGRGRLPGAHYEDAK